MIVRHKPPSYRVLTTAGSWSTSSNGTSDHPGTPTMTALTGHRVPGTLRHLPMMDEGETQPLTGSIPLPLGRLDGTRPEIVL